MSAREPNVGVDGAVDRVLIEVLRNRFQAVAEEMGNVVLWAGHTVFVKETGDFGVGLVSAGGEAFAVPVRVGAHVLVGTPPGDAIRYVAEKLGGPSEGDVYLSNDPVTTGGMATHLPDIFIWKPVFADGQLLCYAWSFIHFSDVGGRVPGSIAPSSTDTFQEGIVIPPVRLIARGELNREMLSVILANSRIPDLNWGDIKAQLAALHTAERRLLEVVNRYGVETVRRGIDGVLDYAEAQARRLVRAMPDGVYRFADYLETDHVPGGRLVRIKLAITVRGSDVTFDFTGSDPQVQAAFNIPSGGKHGHGMIAFGFVSLLRTLEADLTLNSGLVRVLRYIIPKSSLLNADPGIAYGVRAATMFRVFDVVMGALAGALPDVINAAGPSQGAILLVSVPDPTTGGTRVSVVQPLVGGSGGRPMKDGLDGVDVSVGFLKNVPSESIEAEMPVMISRYRLRENSAGAGRYRGGMGIELELKVFPPNAVVTARGMERFTFRPWGRRGGHAGTLGYAVVRPDTDRAQQVGKIDILELEPGESIRVGTQGGGGWGDPLARPPDRVFEDVREELIDAAAARADYGVVIINDQVDVAATEARRAELRAQRGATPPPDFDFGPERVAYEQHWTPELQDAILEATFGFPHRLRHFLRTRLFATLERRFDTGQIVDPAEIASLVADIRRRELGSAPG